VGGTREALTKGGLERFEVPCPNIFEQRRIASVLSGYDDLIEINRKRIALLEELTQALFNEWFVRFRFAGQDGRALIEQSAGSLPEGWQWRSLEDVCAKPNGIQTGPFGSQLHQSDYVDDGVPVVMPKNLINLRIVENDIARISEAKANELVRHRMRLGDVVYGRRGEIGRRAYISKKEDGWFCGTGCLRLRADTTRISSRYFFDALGQLSITHNSGCV
jgi:type I restriction enzyme, S subunit